MCRQFLNAKRRLAKHSFRVHSLFYLLPQHTTHAKNVDIIGWSVKSTKSCSLLNISIVSKSNEKSEKTLCPFLSAGFVWTENNDCSQ